MAACWSQSQSCGKVGEIRLSGAAEMPAFLPSFPVLRWETYLPATWIFLYLGQKHSNEGPVD